MRGLVYGFANSNFMFAYSVCYYYGAWLIINDPDSGLKTDTIPGNTALLHAQWRKRARV